MDQALDRSTFPTTFNGPLEAGVRAVAVLAAAHPLAFDLQKLIAFDYLLVHTGDIGGPTSLHPPVPLHSAAILVRRKLVERALLLMMTRDLIRREVSKSGIRYRAGESAVLFIGALRSEYVVALTERARWLVGRLGSQNEGDFRAIMRRFFDQWVEEFQTAERSLGTDP